jgi:hypothetical protein
MRTKSHSLLESRVWISRAKIRLPLLRDWRKYGVFLRLPSRNLSTYPWTLGLLDSHYPSWNQRSRWLRISSSSFSRITFQTHHQYFPQLAELLRSWRYPKFSYFFSCQSWTKERWQKYNIFTSGILLFKRIAHSYFPLGSGLEALDDPHPIYKY